MKVAVIGATGYIGSAVVGHLQATGFRHSILTELVTSFDVIIHCGGISSVKACNEQGEEATWLHNVIRVHELACQMTPQQTLVVLTDGSIGEGHKGLVETDPIDQDCLTLYAMSHHVRELTLAAMLQGPRCISLRLGAVMGTVPSRQRTDLLYLQLLHEAITHGNMTIDCDAQRVSSVLTMPDLLDALSHLLARLDRLRERFNIYHWASFATTWQEAAEVVSRKTDCPMPPLPLTEHSFQGYSLNTLKFANDFDYFFKDTSGKCLVDRLYHQLPILSSEPCVLCQQKDQLHLLVDLGQQPLANDFFDQPGHGSVYPLQLMHCHRCDHGQLSYFVDRQRLFQHYKYESGTSQTGRQHFASIVERAILGTGLATGTVLDIACNDGAQLDAFQAKGWTTFGVDPAENIVAKARNKGHQIFCGFWPGVSLPEGITFDVIVVQNVLAHVPNPVEFIKGCARVMDHNSLLLVQTSQADMFSLGQIDTVYHEHISFFTPKSFQTLAQLSGFTLQSLDKVAIHGTSFLAVFRLGSGSTISSATLVPLPTQPNSLQFYADYVAKVHTNIRYMKGHLSSFVADGYTLVGVGAAAKGTVLLHLWKNYHFAYVVDESQLKQGTFMPGTSIPVRSFDMLVDESRKLVMVLFAWNFKDELLAKLRQRMGDRPFHVILPDQERIMC